MRWFLLLFLLLFSGCSCRRSIEEETTHQKSPVAIKGSRAEKSDGNKGLHEQTPSLTKKPAGQRRKRSIMQPTDIVRQNEASPASGTDTAIISRIELLRKMDVRPDMNEPINRKFFSQGTPTGPFPSMIRLSNESFIKVNFDNDILDYTDRFYTNGIRIDLITPALHANPLCKIMLPYGKPATNYYGLTLCQNMYTPSTTKTGGILYGDRPYAAYLYLGSFRITNDTLRKLRQTSEILIGIIGPSSYGEWVQRSFHNSVPTNNEPLGWEYQIQNDLILNYNLTIQKGVWELSNLDLTLHGAGALGTLYTNLSCGATFRTGWMNPYFANLGVARLSRLKSASLRRFQCYFILKGEGKIVGYDATLMGGMTNHSSVYTLPYSKVSHLVFQSSAGIILSYGGFQLEAEQFLLSPEFQSGLWHKWIHIGLTFAL